MASRGPVLGGVEPLGTLGSEGVHQFEGHTLILSPQDVFDQGLDQDARRDPALDGPATRFEALWQSLIHGHVDGQRIVMVCGPREVEQARKGWLAGVPGPLGRHPLSVADADIEPEGGRGQVAGLAQLDDQAFRVRVGVLGGNGVGERSMVTPGQLRTDFQESIQIPGPDRTDESQARHARMALGQVQVIDIGPPLFDRQDGGLIGEEPLGSAGDVLVAVQSVPEVLLGPAYEPVQASAVALDLSLAGNHPGHQGPSKAHQKDRQRQNPGPAEEAGFRGGQIR